MAVPVRHGSSYSPLMILLLIGLSALAWISTYSGMLQLIAASSGDIGTPAKIAIGFAVLMLQGMIVYTLDAMFSGQLQDPALSSLYCRLHRSGIDLRRLCLRLLLALPRSGRADDASCRRLGFRGPARATDRTKPA